VGRADAGAERVRISETNVALQIYKRGQGKYTRIITLISGVVIGVLIARYVWMELKATSLSMYFVYGIPVLVLAATGFLMQWVVNRPRSADFMIATEGEMKKVSWSSKKEIVGGTKVVIVTTLFLAALLWSVDMGLSFCMRAINVLEIGD